MLARVTVSRRPGPGCGLTRAGFAEGCILAADNPVTNSDPTGLCDQPGCPGTPGTPVPTNYPVNGPPGNNENGNGGGSGNDGYSDLGPGVVVQNSDPKAAALSQAYDNYLDSVGANPDQVGLSQSYGIWLMICESNPGLCPGSMYYSLLKQGVAGGTPIPSGAVFAVGNEFGLTGGAAELIPVRDANGYLRDALGRFASDPDALVDESAIGEPHGNSFATPRTTYLYRLSDSETEVYLKTGISNDPGSRYWGNIADTTDMEILTSGPRAEMYNLERYIVSIDPGPWNNEPWAGSLLGEGGDGGGGE